MIPRSRGLALTLLALVLLAHDPYRAGLITKLPATSRRWFCLPYTLVGLHGRMASHHIEHVCLQVRTAPGFEGLSAFFMTTFSKEQVYRPTRP